jgi:hypothetical protein
MGDEYNSVADAKYTNLAYRPEFACIMKQGNGPYCRICTEAIVLNIKTIVSTPIDTPSFWDKTQVGYTSIPVEFNLGLLGDSLKYDIAWSLDGAPLPDKLENLTLDPIALNLGTSAHNLKAIVRDTSNYWYDWATITSPFVKNDPTHIMNDTIQWTLMYGITIEKATLAQAQPTLRAWNAGNGIRIAVNPQGEYNLGVYNIHGQQVAELGQGFSRVTMEKAYSPRASGVYFVRLVANKKQYANKVVWFR